MGGQRIGRKSRTSSTNCNEEVAPNGSDIFFGPLRSKMTPLINALTEGVTRQVSPLESHVWADVRLAEKIVLLVQTVISHSSPDIHR